MNRGGWKLCDLQRAGAAGAATAAALDAFFAKEYAGLIYRAVSVCEKDEEGEPISEAVEVPIPSLKAPRRPTCTLGRNC